MNTFNLTLDLNKSRASSPVRLRQGDAQGTTITALVLDHGATADLTGYTAQFVMDLPDGTHYYRKAASIDGNSVSVMADEAQAASVPGRAANAYFQMLQGTTVKASTGSFAVEVLPDALEGHTVPESYDSAIQDAIDALDAAVEQMPDMVEDVLADHPEWTTTVQDGSITKAKLATDLARDRERLLYRLANMLTAQLPEGDVATATDAAKTPVAGLALYGRSTQDGTPTPSAPVAIQSVAAANLLPNNVTTRTIAGVTYTVNEDGTISVSGTATATSNQDIGRGTTMLPAGTYTFGAGTGSGYSLFMYKIVDGTATVLRNSPGTFTLDADTSVFMRIAINSGAVVSGVVSPFIYRGSTAYPYVPYGNAGLWACGKNLFSRVMVGYTMNTSTGEWSASNASNFVSAPIHCTQATLTLLVNSTGGYVGSMFFTCYGADGTYLGQSNGVYFNSITTPYRATINLKSGTVTVRAYGYSSSGATHLLGAEVAVYDGTVSDAYEPYTYTVTPIDLDGHELRSLPDGTRDELTVGADGRVTLVQRVGAATLDGSESWYLSGGNLRVYTQVINGLCPRYYGDDVAPLLCDKFERKTGNQTVRGIVGVSFQNDLQFAQTGATMTVEDWKTWLASNPTTVLYPLATPVTHDLGYVAAVPLCGPDLTAQAIPTAPMRLTYERDLNATLARLEFAIATLA